MAFSLARYDLSFPASLRRKKASVIFSFPDPFYFWAALQEDMNTATRNETDCHQKHFPVFCFSYVNSRFLIITFSRAFDQWRFPALSISELHFPRFQSVTFSRAFHQFHFPALSISYVFPRFSALKLFCVLSSDWVRRALSGSVIGYMVTVMWTILCYVTSRMFYESMWITKLNYITYAAVDNLHLFCYSVRRVFIKKGEVRFWSGMIFFHFSYQRSMQIFVFALWS